jgi:hypothetical protein
MLAKILMILSAWFLLSMIFGLLVGRALSKFRKPPKPGVALPLGTDWEAAAPGELEEIPDPAYLQMMEEAWR